MICTKYAPIISLLVEKCTEISVGTAGTAKASVRVRNAQGLTNIRQFD